MSLCALRPILRTPTLALPHHRPTIALTTSTTPTPTPTTQSKRNANHIRRPRRPYHLPQLVMLSDGSAYTQLSTSPRGVIRSTKDVRNHPLWNPTLHKLADIEEDEAGKLRAFRERFGRGWDSRVEEADVSVSKGEGGEGAEAGAGEVGAEGEQGRKREENLMDLISGGYEDLVMGKNKGLKVKKGAAAAAAAAAAGAVAAAAGGKAEPAAAGAGADKKKKK